MTEKPISFPALDISVDDWNRDNEKENAPEFYFENEYFHHDEESFNKYLKGHDVVDCEGRVYKAAAIEKLHTLASHIPLTAKYRLVLEPTSRTMTFNEVKEYLTDKILTVDDEFDDYKSDWLLSVESAKTIKDLILT